MPNLNEMQSSTQKSYEDYLLSTHIKGECPLGCLFCEQEANMQDLSVIQDLNKQWELHQDHPKMDGYPDKYISTCDYCMEESVVDEI